MFLSCLCSHVNLSRNSLYRSCFPCEIVRRIQFFGLRKYHLMPYICPTGLCKAWRYFSKKKKFLSNLSQPGYLLENNLLKTPSNCGPQSRESRNTNIFSCFWKLTNTPGLTVCRVMPSKDPKVPWWYLVIQFRYIS